MNILTKILFSGLILLVSSWLYKVTESLSAVPRVPELREDLWWGHGDVRQIDEGIRSFQINVSQEVIQDLQASLDRTLKRKQTPPLETQGFQYGFNTDYLPKVLSYWRNQYQWKDRQNYLNQFPQFKTYVNGLDIHYIRVTPKAAPGKRVLPLLLLHGWPGSIREFYELIPLLTTPRADTDFVFDVVAPSLPGYGFSEGAARPGLGAAQIGVVMKNLMKRIGFDKFYVQGGDWGAIITRIMAVVYPDNILGMHSNMCGVRTPKALLKTVLGSYIPELIVEKIHQDKMFPLLDKVAFIIEETGYFHLQATKPDTIGVALSDTPAGLAAYILEKFSTWTNPEWRSLQDGGLSKKFTLDMLLDNVMLYWVTDSIITSQRLYAETFNLAHASLQLDRIPIKVPSACARFKYELTWQPESILKDSFINLLQVSDPPEGGHFAAFEVPKLLSSDIWSAVEKFEKFNGR